MFAVLPAVFYSLRIAQALLPALLLLIATFPYPLRAADEAPDFSKIQRYAALSAAVYDNIEAVERSLPEGFQLIAYQTELELEIACLVVIDQHSGDLTLAVRGTQNLNNALVDLAFKLRPDPLAGIKLHSGFALAARALYKDIEPLLDRARTINTTGHSLGGAVALILAMYLQQDDFKVGEVVTFGQPKVTNIAGADRYNHLKVTRVVTPLDVVPLVPPFDPLDIKDLDIYWHLGREVVLHQDSSFSTLSGLNAMLRATKFTQRWTDQQNLDQHRMSLYQSLIDNKTEQAQQVPYKNSFNLFNLFGSPEQ